MTAPYRELATVPLSCHHTKRCCGVCHCAVGGCLLGLTFTTQGGLFGIGKKKKFGAGASMDRPTGTGAHCWCETHMRWERCEGHEHSHLIPGAG